MSLNCIMLLVFLCCLLSLNLGELRFLLLVIGLLLLERHLLLLVDQVQDLRRVIHHSTTLLDDCGIISRLGSNLLLNLVFAVSVAVVLLLGL